MKNWFTEHPHSVGETYWQHLWFSLRSAVALFVASLAAVIHALCPFLCMSTASKIVAKMAGAYCKGERRDGFLEKVNACLHPSEKCSIRRDIQ